MQLKTYNEFHWSEAHEFKDLSRKITESQIESINYQISSITVERSPPYANMETEDIHELV